MRQLVIRNVIRDTNFCHLRQQNVYIYCDSSSKNGFQITGKDEIDQEGRGSLREPFQFHPPQKSMLRREDGRSRQLLKFGTNSI